MDATSVLALLKLIRQPLIDGASKTARKVTGKPSSDDKRRLLEYVRLLDERRVFYADYNSEVAECCLASLSSFKDRTEEVLSKVEHPGARAALGAILDALRQFLDKWAGFHTPHGHWGWDFPRAAGDYASRRGLAGFFEDLGELRGVMKLLVVSLQVLHPKIEAPNLLEATSPDTPP